MLEIGAFEAKNTLGALLDRVEKGEEIVITRRGKPVARMIGETKRVDKKKAQRMMENIIKRREKFTLGSDLTIRQLIDEGRA